MLVLTEEEKSFVAIVDETLIINHTSFRVIPPGQNERFRISYCTDMDKSVLISNFEKRNWVPVSAEDDWHFYWASVTTCRNIFSVESGYRMQDNQ